MGRAGQPLGEEDPLTDRGKGRRGEPPPDTRPILTATVAHPGQGPRREEGRSCPPPELQNGQAAGPARAAFRRQGPRPAFPSLSWLRPDTLTPRRPAGQEPARAHEGHPAQWVIRPHGPVWHRAARPNVPQRLNF